MADRSAASSSPVAARVLYGRRRGRPMRPGQRELYDDLLPRLAIDVPPSAVFDPRALFPRPPRDIWLEIGFGGGEHLAAQAAAHREIGFLGCEVFENGIVKLLAEIRRAALENVRILADDARLLVTALPEASIERVFVLFPDPWPKQRHHKRRFVAAPMLDALARIMVDGAELRLATDDVDYLRWMLERVTAHPAFMWLVRRPGDWRTRPDDWPETRYEAKARAAGRTPYFLRLARRPRAVAVDFR